MRKNLRRMIHVSQNCSTAYLVNKLRYEYENIFGANCFTTGRYPCRQLVWPCDEDLNITLRNDFFVRACVIFSCATESRTF